MGWRESCEHLLHYLGALPCCSRCPRLYLYPTGVISCEQMNFRHVGLQGSCKENMKQQNLPAETYIAEVVGPKLVWNVLPAKVRQAIASVKADYGNQSAASGSGSSMAPHISGSSEATPPRKVQELAHACRTRSKETVNLFMLCLGKGKSTKRWNYETQHNTGHHKSKTCTRVARAQRLKHVLYLFLQWPLQWPLRSVAARSFIAFTEGSSALGWSSSWNWLSSTACSQPMPASQAVPLFPLKTVVGAMLN